MAIKTDQDFSVIVRKDALLEKNIEVELLKKSALKDTYQGENEKVIAFGPHFGIESAEEVADRFTKMGLSFWDDFFIFHGDIPYWVTFFVDGKV